MFDTADVIIALTVGMLFGAACAFTIAVVLAGRGSDRRRASDRARLVRTQRQLADARQHLGTPYRAETRAAAEFERRSLVGLDQLVHALSLEDTHDHSKHAAARELGGPVVVPIRLDHMLEARS